MKQKKSRRRILKSAATAATGLGFVGTASAHDGDHGPADPALGPARDAPYAIVTYEKSEFAPEVLAVPEGATVTFVGNRYPHTVTSTESWAEVLVGCGDGTAPYSGDAEEDKPASGRDGEKGGDGVIRYTVESPDEDYSVFLESGGTTEITYEGVGRYPYYCVPHCGSLMVGELIVGGNPR